MPPRGRRARVEPPRVTATACHGGGGMDMHLVCDSQLHVALRVSGLQHIQRRHAAAPTQRRRQSGHRWQVRGRPGAAAIAAAPSSRGTARDRMAGTASACARAGAGTARTWPRPRDAAAGATYPGCTAPLLCCSCITVGRKWHPATSPASLATAAPHPPSVQFAQGSPPWASPASVPSRVAATGNAHAHHTGAAGGARGVATLRPLVQRRWGGPRPGRGGPLPGRVRGPSSAAEATPGVQADVVHARLPRQEALGHRRARCQVGRAASPPRKRGAAVQGRAICTQAASPRGPPGDRQATPVAGSSGA